MPKNADELVELLDLERIDDNLFRGRQMPTSRRMVFGGQAAAQSLVAAHRTVEQSHVVHSLHSYFLQPGDPQAPTIYDVETLRDGRSFVTRRVVARQHGRPIYVQTSNFHRPEDGYDHQDAMPTVPGPEQAEPVRAFGRDPGERHEEAHHHEWDVAEFRQIGSSAEGPPEDPDGRARQRLWMRIAGDLPDDPFLHVAGFTYLSDMTLMGAALAPHGERLGVGIMAASLDHAIWFHRPFRADRWWLYDQVSPVAVGGRGLVLAEVFDGDGTLAATVAQEAVIRRRRDR